MARNYARIPDISDVSWMTTKQLRETYSQMRDIFHKRVGRMAAKGLSMAKTYQKGGYGYVPTLKERGQMAAGRSAAEERRALEHDVIELRNKVGASGDTTYGQVSLRARREAIKERNAVIVESLKKAGYLHISKTMIPKFGRFMDEMRKMYGKKLPNSEEMAEFFNNLKYNQKRKSLSYIVELWKEYEANGYKFPDEPEDLYSGGDMYRLLFE